MQKDCWELNKPHKEDNPSPKIIPIPIEDLTSNPKCKSSLVNPNIATNYDQALGVIKDSINTANPLANLNL